MFHTGSSAIKGHGGDDERLRLESTGGTKGESHHGGGEHDGLRKRCSGKVRIGAEDMFMPSENLHILSLKCRNPAES